MSNVDIGIARARGMDADVVISTLASAAPSFLHMKELSVEEEIREMEDTSSGSAYEQFSIGPRKATGTFEGFSGDEEVMANLRAGAEIKTFAVETVTTGFALVTDLGNEAEFGKLIVTKVRYKQGTDPSTWGFDFRTGGH